MNFLTHLFFATESNDHTKGLIIGSDFNPVNLPKYNLDILKGIAIDMQIKSMSDNHPAFHRSLQRIHTKYSGKHALFIINVFYDHLLAKDWHKYSPVSLEDFAEKIYAIILSNRNLMPYKVRKFAPEMISKKYITGIRSLEGTHQYIKLLSKNERYTASLDQCLFELMENYQQYSNEFEEYFSALREFMTEEAIRFNTITDEKEIFLLSA